MTQVATPGTAARRFRRRHRRRRARAADASRSPATDNCGPSSTIRIRACGRGALAHRAPGRDDHRLASSAGLLVRDRPQPPARTAAGRVSDSRAAQWIPRRAAVLHPPTDPPFSETGHWNSTCIACHATVRQAAVRHAVRIAADRHAGRADDAPPSSASRAKRVTGPAAEHVRANRNPLRRYGLAPDRPRPDPTIVQPARLMHGSILGGLRPVPRASGSSSIVQTNAPPTARGLPYRPGDELARSPLRRPGRPINRDSPAMQTLSADDSGFLGRFVLAGWKVRVPGANTATGRVTVLQGGARLRSRRPCLANAIRPRRARCRVLVSHDAQGRRRHGDRWASGRTISSAPRHWTATARACSVTSPYRANRHGAHAARGRFERQLLLQLPHAAHDLRAAQDHSQPHDQQSVGDRRRVDDRPAERVQPHVTSTKTLELDGRQQLESLVRHARRPTLERR